MLKRPRTYATAKAFLEDATAMTAKVMERAQRVLLLGNSGGLALTLGIAGALVGTNHSPIWTLWPALSFALGVLTVGAPPVIMAWRARSFLDLFDNPDASASNLEDDLKQFLERKTQSEGDKSETEIKKYEFKLSGRIQSFVPIALSSLCFVSGLVGGFVALYT